MQIRTTHLAENNALEYRWPMCARLCATVAAAISMGVCLANKRIQANGPLDGALISASRRPIHSNRAQWRRSTGEPPQTLEPERERRQREGPIWAHLWRRRDMQIGYFAIASGRKSRFPLCRPSRSSSRFELVRRLKLVRPNWPFERIGPFWPTIVIVMLIANKRASEGHFAARAAWLRVGGVAGGGPKKTGKGHVCCVVRSRLAHCGAICTVADSQTLCAQKSTL